LPVEEHVDLVLRHGGLDLGEVGFVLRRLLEHGGHGARGQRLEHRLQRREGLRIVGRGRI
jgi:hypothetical protein